MDFKTYIKFVTTLILTGCGSGLPSSFNPLSTGDQANAQFFDTITDQEKAGNHSEKTEENKSEQDKTEQDKTEVEKENEYKNKQSLQSQIKTHGHDLRNQNIRTSDRNQSLSIELNYTEVSDEKDLHQANACDENLWQSILDYSLPDLTPPDIVTEQTQNQYKSKSHPDEEELPISEKSISSILDLWATYYYLPSFNSLDNGVALLNPQGQDLGPKLSLKNWCTAAMEGSVQIFYQDQWTTYNYASSDKNSLVDCSPFFPHRVGGTRFRIARGAFGDGVGQYKLVPFRSIAVDKRKIPYGSVLFVPKARGNAVRLPDGRTIVHDGYFFAADTGGAILDEHIDVFIGRSEKNPFSWIGSKSSAKFKAIIQTQNNIRSCFEKLHQ